LFVLRDYQGSCEFLIVSVDLLFDLIASVARVSLGQEGVEIVDVILWTNVMEYENLLQELPFLKFFCMYLVFRHS
jgi:hypothetical protein